jgi:hypothetical protein
VELSKPRGIEAEVIAEFDLREDVFVALMLGKTARAWQLVEKAEAHFSSLAAGLQP